MQDISRKRLITKKIILIGPDHFSSNQKQISINNEDWNLSTGVMKFEDLNLNLSVNNSLLKNDHAIYNPLADLKIYFPNATIYPILIGQKVSLSSLDELINLLTPQCKFDCLLVASVDFSHYLPATLAHVHDTYTKKILNNFEIDKIDSLEVDSPQSLYIIEKFALQDKAIKFNLFAHTNSGVIASNPDIETTTHFFASYTHGQSKKITSHTSVSVPVNLNRFENQNTLGDRFFYGTDEFIYDPSQKFVVTTVSTLTKTIKSFLPIKNNLFVRGEEKRQLIKEYFDSLSNDQNLTKDYFWGTLIYERNHSSPSSNN